MKEVRIGISGWTYAPWKDVFYPENLPVTKELSFASRQFRSIEINGTFYALQRPSSFQKWYEAVPEDFVFSVKAPRYVTHIHRLKEPDTGIANFFASGLLLLREKLGPILWQIPPSLKYDKDRIRSFLESLPKDVEDAVRKGKKHSAWMKGRVALAGIGNHPLRHAFEPRHESFRQPEFFSLLKDYGVACVVSDSPGTWPRFEEATADFAYARLHGKGDLYSGSYSGFQIRVWEKKVRQWSSGGAGRDVFLYFDNDQKVKAPFDARELATRLNTSVRTVLSASGPHIPK